MLTICLYVVMFKIANSYYINAFRAVMGQRPTVMPSDNLLNYPKMNKNTLSEQDKYDLQWYVIGDTCDLQTNRPMKATIWGHNYVIWKTINNTYVGLDDVCSHKGASLSNGKIVDGNIMCPYHGYEFDENGCLDKVPGLCFHPAEHYNINKYDVVEKNGWVYLNTYDYKTSRKIDVNGTNVPETFQENIFEEEDVRNNSRCVKLEMNFKCYSRILSENSLDVMHIAFVHTFGNARNPSPTYEIPPKQVGRYHYKTTYEYKSGEMSMAKRLFDVRDLRIENEFILPHTTIARVFFGDFVSTVVTFALPIDENRSKLYVKTYRNFWENPIGDAMTKNMMYNTMCQDKAIVENIDPRFQDGKYNMKFDKIQNTYKTLYRKFIKRT